jgi:hypothetical protein
MCFEYDDSVMESWPEDQLQVLQIIPALGGEWLDVTGSIDTVNNVICTDMAGIGPDSFTCFAIVTLDGPTGAPWAGAGLKLRPNSPNPFNPSTQIRFELGRDETRVQIEIFDLAGRRVRRLVDGALSAGPQTAVWDGRNDAGRTVASGVYPLRLTAGDEVRMQRLVLLK